MVFNVLKRNTNKQTNVSNTLSGIPYAAVAVYFVYVKCIVCRKPHTVRIKLQQSITSKVLLCIKFIFVLIFVASTRIKLMLYGKVGVTPYRLQVCNI